MPEPTNDRWDFHTFSLDDQLKGVKSELDQMKALVDQDHPLDSFVFHRLRAVYNSILALRGLADGMPVYDCETLVRQIEREGQDLFGTRWIPDIESRMIARYNQPAAAPMKGTQDLNRDQLIDMLNRLEAARDQEKAKVKTRRVGDRP